MNVPRCLEEEAVELSVITRDNAAVDSNDLDVGALIDELVASGLLDVGALLDEMPDVDGLLGELEQVSAALLDGLPDAGQILDELVAGLDLDATLRDLSALVTMMPPDL